MSLPLCKTRAQSKKGDKKRMALLEIKDLHAVSWRRGDSQIVHGFCKEVFRELPMEFAVEAQKLLGVKELVAADKHR